MAATFAYVRIQRQQRHGRGPRKTQTAPFAARLFATAELGCPACWSWPRVRRTLSSAPRNPPVVLCQHPQKSFLLPRLRPGWRSPALCPVVPPSVLSSEPRLPRAIRCSSSRSCGCARASCRLLSAATPSLPRGAALSETTRTVRSRRDPRTAHWLRPGWEFAPASHHSRLFLRSLAASRPAQFTGLRCLLPTHHLPLLPRRTRHQSLRAQHHRGRRPSVPPRLDRSNSKRAGCSEMLM